MNEAYVALNNEMPILAAIGICTAFDRAMELLNIDPNLTFKDKLDKLVKEETLTSTDRTLTAALVDSGSAAEHRGWRPADGDRITMISIPEAI